MKADFSPGAPGTPKIAKGDDRPSLTVECIAYSPLGAAHVTGRSRSRIFKAIKNKELIARKDGRATLLEASELERWIKSLPVSGQTETAAA
jgi:hypothetical protein